MSHPHGFKQIRFNLKNWRNELNMIESENIVPNFDENGNLPLKCYEVTLDEIKEKFVDAFPNSKTRKSRFECFLDFIEDLQKMLNHALDCL